MKENRTALLTSLFAVLLLAAPLSAPAADREAAFPTKPIRLLILEGPGGSNDVPTRALAKAVEKVLGQPIVCMNMPGGGGVRLLTELRKEEPDGHVLGTFSAGTIIASLWSKVDFSVSADFSPVLKYQGHPLPVAVKKDAPWNSWEDFVKAARTQKEPMKIGMWGSRSLAWMALEEIAKKEHLTFTYVPFSSTGEAMSSILGGHTDVTTGSSGIMYSKPGGTLKTLLLFSSGPIKDLPGVPTAGEKGFSGLGLTGGWSGIMAPKGVPAPVLNTLQEAFRKGLQDSDYQALLAQYNLLVDYKSGKEFGEELRVLEGQVKEILKNTK